jgi:uncharacterized membrane protein YdbT with pleckstrin-like domain
MENIIPNHKYFATQKEDEKVLLITRRHWIVYVPSAFIGALVIISCIVFYSQMDRIPLAASSELVAAIMTVFLSILMLFTALFVYVLWIVNYLNLQVVTNQNLVDVDQLGLFSRKISELTIEDIQDVSATQHGILQSFLHYGDIIVQTAGENMNFTFEKIKNPYDIAKKIMEIKEKYGAEEVTTVIETAPDEEGMST